MWVENKIHAQQGHAVSVLQCLFRNYILADRCVSVRGRRRERKKGKRGRRERERKEREIISFNLVWFVSPPTSITGLGFI